MERDRGDQPPQAQEPPLGGWHVGHAEIDKYGPGWRYPDGRPVLAEREAVDHLEQAMSYTRIASAGLGALGASRRHRRLF